LTIKALPATGVNEGQVFQNLYDAADVLAQGPDVAAPEARTLTAGVLELANSRNVWVETEGSAALDQLTAIDLDTLPANLTVRIRQADAAHVIDIVHLANAGAGGGEFDLNAVAESGGTVRLDSLEKSLTVERRGSTIYEVRRDGFAGTGGFDGELTVPLDGGDQPVSRLRWTMEDALVVGGEYEVVLTDSGKWKNVRQDCEVMFPDPNESGSGWQAGHNVAFQQWGSLLTYVTHVGTTPSNPLNHDRGLGVRSVQHGIVCEENNGTLTWLLSGMTAANEGGGGGGGTVERSYAYTDILTTVDLPIGSTAFVACGSMTFTPAASSDYLLFCDATFSADAINTTNDSKLRLVNVAAPTTPLCEVGRPRQPSQEHRSTFLLGATFGASPTAQTYRLEAANASTTHSTRVEGPRFFALKLSANEGYASQSGVVSDVNQTYDVVATKTMTLAAGTYVFFSQFGVTTATDHRWSGKLTVDGVDYNETAASNINPGIGLYSTFRVLTIGGGTVTFSTSIKSDGSGGTAAATHGIVGVLAAASFQVFAFGESIAETSTTTSAALTAKVSKTTSLQSGWRSFVWATMQAHSDQDANATGVAIELHRNGSAIGIDAEHAGRIQTGQPAAYSPTSWSGFGLMAPGLTNDVFELKYASLNSGANVKVASASIAILALAPL
jgi:hypothetical protein